MKRSTFFFGLPAMTIAALCASSEAKAADLGQTARIQASRVVSVAAQAAATASRTVKVARPLTDRSGRPAPGNCQSKGGDDSTTAVPAAAPAAKPAPAETAARPLTDASGAPAPGNVQGKGCSKRTRSAWSRRVAP